MKDFSGVSVIAKQFLQDGLEELSVALSLSAKERASLIARVGVFPQSAFMLLQLLRYNELCENDEALLAESFAYGVLQSGDEFKNWLKRRPVSSCQLIEKDSPVLLRRDNDVLQIVLNRPHVRNAYSASMRDAFYDALQVLDADETLEKCVITGKGDCFCVGGDLNEFGSGTDSAQAYAIRRDRNVAGLLLKNAGRIKCYVHGACIGSGIELPACSGTLTANKNTFFQLPELGMGLIPGAGGTVSILRRIGRLRLSWWILSGKKINAQTALEWGLIDELHS